MSADFISWKSKVSREIPLLFVPSPFLCMTVGFLLSFSLLFSDILAEREKNVMDYCISCELKELGDGQHYEQSKLGQNLQEFRIETWTLFSIVEKRYTLAFFKKEIKKRSQPTIFYNTQYSTTLKSSTTRIHSSQLISTVS